MLLSFIFFFVANINVYLFRLIAALYHRISQYSSKILESLYVWRNFQKRAYPPIGYAPSCYAVWELFLLPGPTRSTMSLTIRSIVGLLMVIFDSSDGSTCCSPMKIRTLNFKSNHPFCEDYWQKRLSLTVVLNDLLFRHLTKATVVSSGEIRLTIEINRQQRDVRIIDVRPNLTSFFDA